MLMGRLVPEVRAQEILSVGNFFLLKNFKLKMCFQLQRGCRKRKNPCHLSQCNPCNPVLGKKPGFAMFPAFRLFYLDKFGIHQQEVSVKQFCPLNNLKLFASST